MFHLILNFLNPMKTDVLSIYSCAFHSNNVTRVVRVAASSFGRAAALAHSHTSNWEDVDKFSLVSICLQEPIVVSK